MRLQAIQANPAEYSPPTRVVHVSSDLIKHPLIVTQDLEGLQ